MLIIFKLYNFWYFRMVLTFLQNWWHLGDWMRWISTTGEQYGSVHWPSIIQIDVVGCERERRRRHSRFEKCILSYQARGGFNLLLSRRIFISHWKPTSLHPNLSTPAIPADIELRRLLMAHTHLEGASQRQLQCKYAFLEVDRSSW